MTRLEHSAGGTQAGVSPGPALEDTRAETLRLLFEVNERCLHLMAQFLDLDPEAAHAPMPAPLRNAWRSADAATLSRAATFPALLLDIRAWGNNTRTDARRWFFPERLALPLMRSALTLAWHVCRTERQAAGILLGLPPESASLFRQMGLHDLEQVAQTHAHCLGPRWTHAPAIWLELFAAARGGDRQAFDAFKLRALQTLLGEFLPLSPSPSPRRSRRRALPAARARSDGIPSA